MGTLVVNWLISDQLLRTLVTCFTIQIYQNLRLNFGDDDVQFLRQPSNLSSHICNLENLDTSQQLMHNK